MNVRWTARARDGFRRETRRIAQDSPSATQRVAAPVRTAASTLSTHPGIGRAGRVLDTRELVVAPTPFIIVYRVRGQSVEVVAIVHQALQWPEEFDVTP